MRIDLGGKHDNWQIKAMFHQSMLNKVREATKATHVSHIKGKKTDKGKINCIHIKRGDKEIFYGGDKDFSLFTREDYQEAIKEFNKE